MQFLPQSIRALITLFSLSAFPFLITRSKRTLNAADQGVCPRGPVGMRGEAAFIGVQQAVWVAALAR